MDCGAEIEQPPPGEFGRPLCLDNTCQAYANKKSTSIGPEGYHAWTASETLDNARRFHDTLIPRYVVADQPGEPLVEQLLYIDLNDQDDDRFDTDAVVANETHITIPFFNFIHAGYSKSYHLSGHHETGIVTFQMSENDVSLITDYPKIAFAEKYHALTHEGPRDTSRGDYILERSKEGMKEEWSVRAWVRWATETFASEMLRRIPFGILESVIERAHSWQIRRWVKDYPQEDTGKINPTDTPGWATHAARAKRAIGLARDRNWVRDLKYSQYECKHFEKAPGLTIEEDSVTFPLGRPLTIHSGEDQQSPQYFITINSGYGTWHFDPEANVLQLYVRFFAYSRLNADVKFPGAHPNGVWLKPLAEGSEYAIDPSRDGRTDQYHRLDRPLDTITQVLPFGPSAEFTLWLRPTEETCDQSTLDDGFWGAIDLDEWSASKWLNLLQGRHFYKSVVHGIACGKHWMSEDYGNGSKGFGVMEYATWLHMLTEVRPEKTKFVALNDVWDTWECFYKNKDMTMCTS